jgi:hypothetical protein
MTDDIVNERRRTVVVVPLSSSPLEGPPLLIGVATAGKREVLEL